MQEVITNQQNTISLHWRERQKLVDLLLKCSSITDPDTRDSIISDLSVELKSPIKRNRQLDITDVRNLIDVCIQYQDGLNTLVEMIEQREPKALPVQEVKQFVEQTYAGAAREKKKPQYDKLLLILSTVTESNLARVDLERFYCSSVIDNRLSQFNYPLKNSKVETLAAIQEILRVTPDTDGIPVVLKFIERVATAIRAKKLSAELTHWIDETVQAWGIRDQNIVALRAEVALEFRDTKQRYSATPTAQRPYILIKLKPIQKEDREKFSAEAWIYSGPDDIDYEYVPEQGEFYTATTIDKLLDKLVAQVNSSTKIDPEMKGEYAIDFFLPRELFCCPVELWSYKGFPLGIQSQVVIRSSEERLRDGTFKSRWENKWAKLHDLAQQEGRKPIHWVSRLEELNATKVLSKLMDAHIVCLGLTLVPPTIADPCNKQELFYSMFMAGTPIALWPRRSPNNPEKLPKFQKAIKLLIQQQQLSDLPGVILKQRQNAHGGKNDDHIGYCLVLLWDDPNRVPLKFPLVEPELAKDVTYAEK